MYVTPLIPIAYSSFDKTVDLLAVSRDFLQICWLKDQWLQYVLSPFPGRTYKVLPLNKDTKTPIWVWFWPDLEWSNQRAYWYWSWFIFIKAIFLCLIRAANINFSILSSCSCLFPGLKAIASIIYVSHYPARYIFNKYLWKKNTILEWLQTEIHCFLSVLKFEHAQGLETEHLSFMAILLLTTEL